ncbi:MAG: DUF3393 domain-containing protein [Gammaproteobacteria bacterium]|nr:DUF3393 domain-containing protein [Gammaproteobacteria bacterium]MBD3776445.1 DUF3393 domain-containing protein [Thiotrichales bacterium]
MKIHPSLLSILCASGLLVLVAGEAFSGFQNWVRLQGSVDDKPLIPQVFEPSGIRLISSTAESSIKKSEPSKEPLELMPGRVNNPTAEAVAYSMDETPKQDGLKEVESTALAVIPERGTFREREAKPALVVLENELVIEFPAAIADAMLMKRVIARVLLSEQPFKEDLLSRKSLDYQKTPYFYRQVLDQHHQPIRYPANAFDYADYLFSSERMENIADEEGTFTVVSIPLVKADYPKPVQKYKDWVAQYAQTYKVDPALVFAVMETESRFKPDAVSRSNALGLMQLKADAAGRDIYQHIDRKPGMPNADELFDERNNIRMGTAYLGLLKHEYLAEVRNTQNKEMLSIASYNGGLSTVLKLFGDTPEEAIKRINQLHPKQVYRKLRLEHASQETRDYLDKVLKAKSRYQQLLSA